MPDSSYERLRDAGLAMEDATQEEIDAINSSLTTEDVDQLIAAKDKLPDSSLRVLFAQPCAPVSFRTPDRDDDDDDDDD